MGAFVSFIENIPENFEGLVASKYQYLKISVIMQDSHRFLKIFIQNHTRFFERFTPRLQFPCVVLKEKIA